MGRRRSQSAADRAADELGDLLTLTPWWVGPVIALGAVLSLRFILPPLIALAGEPIGTIFSSVCRQVAPLGGVAVLVIWGIAEVKKFSRRRLLDTRSDLESLRALTWQQFEQLVGESLRRRGYVVQETGGGGADGGVDLRLHREGKTTLVQCKQWRSWKLGVKVVREMFGVMASEAATAGIIVTVGQFTRDAKQFANGKPLELIDGPALLELVKDVQARSHEPGFAIAEATTTTPEQSPPVSFNSPQCPKCGSPMVLRTARKGSNAGSQFFGCSQFPGCRGIVNLESTK